MSQKPQDPDLDEKPKDIDDGILVPILSLLAIAAAVATAWWRGLLQDPLAWGSLAIFFVFYVLVSLVAFPTIRRHFVNPWHRRSFWLFVFLPGWFVGRCVARLFGAEQLYS